MRILFLHGWNSVPGGVKPTYQDFLRSAFCEFTEKYLFQSMRAAKVRVTPKSETASISFSGKDFQTQILFLKRDA